MINIFNLSVKSTKIKIKMILITLYYHKIVLKSTNTFLKCLNITKKKNNSNDEFKICYVNVIIKSMRSIYWSIFHCKSVDDRRHFHDIMNIITETVIIYKCTEKSCCSVEEFYALEEKLVI